MGISSSVALDGGFKELRSILTIALVGNREARAFVSLLEDILLEFDSYLQQIEQEHEQDTEELDPILSPSPHYQPSLFHFLMIKNICLFVH